MKNGVVIREKALLWAILIMILSVFGACQKEGGLDEEGMIDLKDIPENPEYANLSLIGTTWKLIGFGNESTGKLKPAEPEDCEKCYKISFNDNGEIWGQSIVNFVNGSFSFEQNTDRVFKEFSFGQMTYAGEFHDGGLFIDAMKGVSKYDITTRGLLLYYSSREYLLFEPKLE